jgi:hypothetical protein
MHARREDAWATEAVYRAAAQGKKPEDVTLSRAFQFRKRREKLDHINSSKPVFDRVPGPAYWQMSLRGANARSDPYLSSPPSPVQCLST